MIRSLVKYIISFFALIFLQILVFNNIQFSGFINPYFYVLFIILLPFETPGWLLLTTSFLLGISVDVFTHTLGMHAAACTFMAFIRPTILKTFSPRDGYESGTMPRLSIFGLEWFAKYALILIFTHHMVLFYTEMFRFSDFFYTFLRVILSTIFTGLLVVISQYFVFRR